MRRFSVTSANSSDRISAPSLACRRKHTRHNGKAGWESSIFRGFGESKVPAVIFDCQEFILRDNSPYKVRGQRPSRESEVQSDIILGSVVQVDKCAAKLVKPLEEVVTWLEGKDRVEGHDIASSRGEVIEVRVPVLGKAFLARRFRELLFEDGAVRVQPLRNKVSASKELLHRDVPLVSLGLVPVDSYRHKHDIDKNAGEEVDFILEHWKDSC